MPECYKFKRKYYMAESEILNFALSLRRDLNKSFSGMPF